MTNQHAFIQPDGTNPLISEVRQVAVYILSWYGKQQFSVSKLQKMGKLQLTWDKGSGEIIFQDLVNHIQATRSYDEQILKLPRLEDDWLDYTFSLAKPDAPIATVDRSEFAKFDLQTPFGKEFPYKARIDREGVAYANFQHAVQTNIVRLYKKLLTDAHLATGLEDVTWLNDLRMLVNECVSLVDITLHQLYYMAQYRGKEKGWKFEPEKLGSKHGMRLEDKLSWIGKITGRPLDNAQQELSDFRFIKNIRNHFNHFDPPCVAYTMEDLVEWFNKIPTIGKLVWKIRSKLGCQLSKKLVEIIFLQKVKFVPMQPELSRVPQPSDVGYLSSATPANSMN